MIEHSQTVSPIQFDRFQIASKVDLVKSSFDSFEAFSIENGDKSASSIFRKVMGVVVEDINIWAKTKGAKQMLLKYADEIGATFEYVSKHKDGFLMKECKSLINQMCAEARRSMRKGNGGDSTMETTVIMDDSSDETETKQDRPKRKLAIEDDDDADESELE